MKTLTRFIIAFLGILLVAGCSQSLVPERVSEGSITVKLPSSVARGILPVATAQASVTQYAVYAFDPTSSAAPKYTVLPSTASSGTLNVAVGSYSVLVVATGANYLLAAGEQTAVNVTAGNTTTVSITLMAVDFSFTVTSPPAIGSGTSISVTLKGNTAVSSIQVGYFRWSLYDSSTSTAVESGYYTPTSPLFSGTYLTPVSVSCTIPLTTSITATMNQISFCGANLMVKEGSAQFSLAITNFLGYGYAPASINGSFIQTFTPSPATGVGITIGWGADY